MLLSIGKFTLCFNPLRERNDFPSRGNRNHLPDGPIVAGFAIIISKSAMIIANPATIALS